ncbi:MAG: MgtC/SapB family protein [Anaerolineae bacterium]|nr:MgtC/SapB family protein [Anaerolineae bacterium]MDW8099526.1 MgtC/SapB family protein [Anaerolineae bacterium]
MDRPMSLQAMHLVIVLAVALLIGAERERDQAEREEGAQRQFGGVRTFPIIGIAGYLLSLDPWAYTAGLLALGALLAVSHRFKIQRGRVGMTTEVAALVTYALGPIVRAEALWLAVASGIATVLLLQLKQPMEQLARHLSDEEILTFTQFALVTAVVLPLLPNRSFTVFELNPFRVWLVVVAIASVSYLSYLLQRWRGSRQGILVAAILGGIYSSTATTVALARQGRHQPTRAKALAGAVLLATGVMYLRLLVLISLFAPALSRALMKPFVAMAILAAVIGGIWMWQQKDIENTYPALRNPLQLGPALIFAAVFVGIQVITRLTAQNIGHLGLYVLAWVMGIADIDPFILSLTQQAHLPVRLGTMAIAWAIASNNMFKGIYAWRIGNAAMGHRALPGLTLLGGLTVVAIAIFVQ